MHPLGASHASVQQAVISASPEPPSPRQDLRHGTGLFPHTRSLRTSYRAIKPCLFHYPTTVFSLNPCGFATQIFIFQIFLKVCFPVLYEHTVFLPSLLLCQRALSSSSKDPFCQFEQTNFKQFSRFKFFEP